jgi:hypothetical protein
MIKLIKLVTGEDIICEVASKTAEKIVLKKPHRLLFSKEGLASMPLCPFSKSETYEIDTRNVLFEVDPEPEIEKSYTAQVGSIVLPPKGIVKP